VTSGLATGKELGAVLDRLDTAACVVTSAYEGRLAGCLVTYVTAASIDPARLLVLTSHENLTHELVELSGVLAVHPLMPGQETWVRHFGLQSGRDIDKFAGLRWERGETGAPLLAEALGYVEGRVLGSLPCGDHTARLVEPVAAALRSPETAPLRAWDVYADGLDEPRSRSLFPRKSGPAASS
jgi:flavin reductase (DIM6/NTAB) family NADH-FMN oxidoreductase RutF